MTTNNYTFFWSTKHFNGWASQWYPAPFTAPVTFPGDDQQFFSFPTAEHYMMLHKALLFDDYSVARDVLAITGSSPTDLTAVKALGRSVSNFDENTWVQHRSRIVLEGNLLKFRQNPEIKEKLLATGETLIVEASPRDRIWGIGFGEKNALARKDRWGLNLLGKALTETRRILREEMSQMETQSTAE